MLIQLILSYFIKKEKNITSKQKGIKKLNKKLDNNIINDDIDLVSIDEMVKDFMNPLSLMHKTKLADIIQQAVSKKDMNIIDRFVSQSIEQISNEISEVDLANNNDLDVILEERKKIYQMKIIMKKIINK